MNDKPRKRYVCNFFFESDEPAHTLEARISAALEVEGLDFDPMTVEVDSFGPVDDEEAANEADWKQP